MNDSIKWAIGTLTSLSQMGYTGKIELNFFEGGVSGANLSQSIKSMTEVRVTPIVREIVSVTTR